MGIRMRALLVAAVIGATTLVSPVVMQSAAQAKPSCPYLQHHSGAFVAGLGPFWWASKGAAMATGGARRVVDIMGPWVDNGTITHLWNFYGGDSQYWCMYPWLAQHEYKIMNAYSHKCLDIEGPWADDFTRVHQWGCDEYADEHSQIWRQESMGQVTLPVQGTVNLYRFRNLFANKCLDVTDWDWDQGTPLQIYDCHAGDNQQWF